VRDLLASDPSRPVETWFYVERALLVDRFGTTNDTEVAAPFRIAADDLDRLSNAAVLKTLRADRKLASAKAEDFEAGLSLLDEAIRDTERRLF
jgi:hypothetical protein